MYKFVLTLSRCSHLVSAIQIHVTNQREIVWPAYVLRIST